MITLMLVEMVSLGEVITVVEALRAVRLWSKPEENRETWLTLGK